MFLKKIFKKLITGDKKTLAVRGIALGAAAFALLFLIIVGAMLINVYRAHDVKTLTAGQIYLAAGGSSDKLMIVAHPDDEAIWGGGHLAEGGWLVVCITNGRSSTRSAEFEKAVYASGNNSLILEYPDKVNFMRDNWSDVYQGIERDVLSLLNYKDWSVIATHNPEGEYGHEHHVMTSNIVTGVCAEKGMLDRLMYFGKYYSAGKIGEHESEMTPITSEQLEFKNRMLTIYSSQEGTIDKFSHIIKYEMWVPAKEWR